jgi:hypothetical protein
MPDDITATEVEQRFKEARDPFEPLIEALIDDHLALLRRHGLLPPAGPHFLAVEGEVDLRPGGVIRVQQKLP